MSLFDMVFGKGKTKNINNLNQEINNVSEIESPNNYTQSDMFKSLTDRMGQPEEAPPGTFTHSGTLGDISGPGESYDPDIKSDYDMMMEEIGGRYGQSSEQMEDMMNRISHHETGPNQRMNPAAIQEGGGPGRGLFQFETGEGQGGMTAMRRMREYYRDVLGQQSPEWTEYNPREGVDASTLTPEQQKMLFMANTRMSKHGSFEGVSPDNLANWWNQYHYAGPRNKMNAFHESMADYDITDTAENRAFNY